MKPGPAISALADRPDRARAADDRLGQRARIGPRLLGQHHRRIGGQVAVRGIARRLDADIGARQSGGQRSSFQRGQHGVDLGREGGVQGLGSDIARAVSLFAAPGKG